ncbi:MAG: HAD family hydrolase [Caldilineaceae bacterium]
MALLRFANHAFAADLVIFDKDGTLIDFKHLWAQKTIAGVERLVQAVQGNEQLRRDLYHTLGYDHTNDQFNMQGPMLVAAMQKLYTIAATVLFQYGWSWLEAELLVESHFVPGVAEVLTPALLRPTTNLSELFLRLRAANVHIAVITSDDRASAEKTLKLLGIREHVAFVAGADDVYPPKPAPEAILAACKQVGVKPARTVMVGDSTTDMVMAQRAGVGFRLAVLTGIMDRMALAAYADHIVESIESIEIMVCSR